MPDLQIRNDGDGFDLVVEDGDLVMLTEIAADVGQRVTYHLMTWLGESPYDRRAGIPYQDVIFGFEPVPGAVALLVSEIQSIEGVAEVIGDPVSELEDRTLSISLTLRAEDADAPINLALDIDAVLA